MDLDDFLDLPEGPAGQDRPSQGRMEDDPGGVDHLAVVRLRSRSDPLADVGEDRCPERFQVRAGGGLREDERSGVLHGGTDALDDDGPWNAFAGPVGFDLLKEAVHGRDGPQQRLLRRSHHRGFPNAVALLSWVSKGILPIRGPGRNDPGGVGEKQE